MIGLDLSLESCIDITQAKVPRYDYGRLEWKANSTFQLHRLAHETMGSGTWTRATKDVPVTGPGGVLSRLDIADRDHRRLAEHRDVASKENAESSAGDDDTQSAVEMEPDEMYSVYAETHTHDSSLHIRVDSQSDGAESMHYGSRPMHSKLDLGEILWPGPQQPTIRASTY